MRSKTLTLVAVLIISTLCLLELIKANKPNLAAVPQKAANEHDRGVPEFVVYGFLFRKMSRLSKKTRELRSQGKHRDQEYHPLQKEAALTTSQSIALEAIASECDQALARQDEEANQIIRSFRERFPPGKLAEGTRLPPPPPELIAMTKQRNEIILAARDQARAALGEVAFAKLDTYARLRYRK